MPTFATEEEAYAAGKYDVVVVANPPVFHVESGTKAVKAGAHVLMEKNISHKVEGAEEFLKLADSKKKIIAVSFMYRFYDTLQYIKSVLDAGTLGKIFSAQATFSEYLPDWHPWEGPKDWYDSQKSLGGSELYGENHTIDLSRWFFGEPTEVSAYVQRISNVTVDTDDLAEVTLIHESGVVTQIHLDMFGRKSRKDMWIMGEKGNLYWDSYMGGNRVEYFNGETKKSEVFMGKVSRNDAFTDFLADFLECVKTGRQPVINGWEALKTLKITAIAEQSSKEGKRKTIQ
jgi:predicted dehydrogenase